MDALDLEITRVRALHAIASGVTRLTWLAAATRFELAMRRHALALKYGYNPSQPRDELDDGPMPMGMRWNRAVFGSLAIFRPVTRQKFQKNGRRRQQSAQQF
jgi:hypothetical protein